MATKQIVSKVWIEEGCIVCDACETAAPDVFEVQEETCVIRPEALNAEFTTPRSESIVDAAEECPVDVIKFEGQSVEVADAEAGETAKEAPTQDTAVAAQPAAYTESKAQPAPKPETKPEPTKAQPTKAQPAKAIPAVTASVAGQPDPAIQALLRAATSRGGNAGIMKHADSVPASVGDWDRQNPQSLPPEARQARTLEAARKAKQGPDKQRRALTGGAALTIGWVTVGASTGISIGPAFARFMMPNVLEEPDPRVRVGKLKKYTEMVPGGVNEDYKPQGIWMIREENRIAALSTICTHLGCIPNWLPNDRKFKCPCHGSGYKFNGINFEGPTPRPLERFRLKVEDGIVTVDKSKKYRYELGQWDQQGSFILV